MRLIDADAVVSQIRKDLYAYEADLVKDYLDLFPNIDAVPVVHGRWNNIGIDEFVCSNCGEHVEYQSRVCIHAYCHKCGAKMDLK